MLNTAVIVLGGDPIGHSALEELPQQRWVIAADSGLDHAARIGLRVDFVVGDMDSVSAANLEAHVGPIDRYPVDKDATDFELALDRAAATPNISRIIVLGGTGGRIDHFLANASVIASPRYAAHDIEWSSPMGDVIVVRDHVQLHGVPGQTVSLIPVGGSVDGTTTSGLTWNLTDDRLAFGSTLGVSNTFASSVATVRITSGCLLAVMPRREPPGQR